MAGKARTTEGGDGKREFVPDLMRCIAVITAIMTHSLQQDISGGIITASGAVYRSTVVYILCLVCNPVYVMLSGALLLRWKEESPVRFYMRRLKRVFIPMVIYYLWYVYVNHAQGTAVDASYIYEHVIRNLLTGSTGEAPHYWLMYVLLSLYIVFPFFRFMFRDMPYHTLTVCAAVILVMMGASVYLPAAGLTPAVSTFLSGWCGVAVLGYWVMRKETRKYDSLLIAAGALAAVFSAWIISFRADAVELLANTSPAAALFAMGLFSLCFRCFGNTVKIPVFIQLLSRHSFGILLIHWYVLHRIVRDRLHLTGGLGTAGALPGTIAAVCATCMISFVIACILDRTLIHLLDKLPLHS